MAASSVPRLYRGVIDDVYNNVREAFLDDGVDEQVLIELKQTWERKLVESKAIDHREPEPTLATATAHAAIQQTLHVTHHPSQQQASAQHPSQTQVTSPAIAHQITLPAGSLVQQVLQYTTTNAGGGVETVTLAVPQKVTITLPTQNAQQGLQTVMSAPAAAATLALHPDVAASILQQAALNQGLNASQAQAANLQPDHAPAGLQYQTITPDQLGKQPQYTVTVGQPTSNTHQQVRKFTTAGNPQQAGGIIQLDGTNDTSDDEEEEEDFQENDDDREDNDDEQNDDENEYIGEEEEPLNSDDDVSDEDPSEIFETDNVVVCQYDKITRSRNRWKFHLKDGIMNLQGKDFVFQKAVGDAEW